MSSIPPLLIIGNWKLNPPTLADAKELFVGVRDGLKRKTLHNEVMVAPPFPFIADMARLSPSGKISIAAQTMSSDLSGAHTGEVALPMLKSIGVQAVIVGHSERRAAGETDEDVAAMIQVLAKGNVRPIVCVGEQDRDSHGQFYSFVEAQVKHVLAAMPKRKLGQLVIAYEPIWAIGTGTHATPADVCEMKLFIQKVIADQCGRAAIKKVRILYGGSVKPENAAALLTEGDVDGFLIGGASLKPKSFVSIVDAAEAYVKTAA